jgi:hypothetical protein
MPVGEAAAEALGVEICCHDIEIDWEEPKTASIPVSEYHNTIMDGKMRLSVRDAIAKFFGG